MKKTSVKIEKEVANAICDLFPAERICCLLRYGPAQISHERTPADFDFLLLLDAFDREDYPRTRAIKQRNLPIEIFIDYKSHVLLRGLQSYQRGCHGAYFIHILATAKTLLGKNFFADFVHDISAKEVQDGLLNRIEEYFYRVQKDILNSQTQTVSTLTTKYLARILTDLLLLNDEINFADMNRYHYVDIIESKLSDSPLFDEDEVTQIQNLFLTETPSTEDIMPTIAILYQVFEELIKTHHDAHV